MNPDIPENYFQKLRENSLTDSDRREFQQWMLSAPHEEIQEALDKIASYFEIQKDAPIPDQDKLIAAIEQRIDDSEPSEFMNDEAKRYSIWPRLKKAMMIAATIAVVWLGYLIFKKTQLPVQKSGIAKTMPIIPGSNKAILTLGNGQSIVLDNAKKGVVANQGNVNVIKSASGQLAYSGQNTENVPLLNTISIPRGGQFQVTLSDGTKVWLNAASSLKFPVHFTGAERKVELSGEAYFEVAKDKQHPFKVLVSNGSEVKVFGTHFNIMAYPDEQAVKTTLLEGSVQISYNHAQQFIVPGEQAVVTTGINVVKVKTSEAIEWKNGNFSFVHEHLPAIMRKISRWYDVDIAYQGKVTDASFMGTLPRSQNIAEVLKYLELTGFVHFKITERRVIVMP